MAKKKELVSINLKIRRSQHTRLLLLTQSLSEKMNKNYTVDDLVQKIIDDFLS